MPQATDLEGVGVPGEVARIYGNQASTVNCTGTAQATAALIKSHSVEVVPSASNTGAIFSSSALVGTPHYFFNAQSTSAVIYGAVGDFMNGSQNGSFTLAQNKSAILWKYKQLAGNGYWCSKLTN